MIDALALAAPYLLIVKAAAELQFGAVPPVPLILAQIEQESMFNAKAKSGAGAMGLMQFMPGTATWVGQARGRPAQPYDPVWSIESGVWYDGWLYQRLAYRGDRQGYRAECDRWGAVLSSYNGGLGNHNKRQAASSHPQDFWYWVSTVRPDTVSEANQRQNYEYPRSIVFERQRKWDRPEFRLVCIYRRHT